MKFVFIILLLVSTPVLADINTRGLTEEQQAEMALQAAKIREAEQSKEWVDIGDALGESIGAAAAKLDITVNEFVDSCVGKLMAFAIVYKVISKDLLRVIIFIPLFIFITFLLLYIYKRSCLIESIFYDEKGKKKEIKYFNPEDNDAINITRFIIGLIWIGCLLGCSFAAFS